MYELVLKKLLHNLLSPTPIYKLKFLCFGYFFTFVVFCIRLLKNWVLFNCKEIYEYLYGLTITEHIFLCGEIILPRNLSVLSVSWLQKNGKSLTFGPFTHSIHRTRSWQVMLNYSISLCGRQLLIYGIPCT